MICTELAATYVPAPAVVPEPVPAVVKVNVYCGVNVAVQVVSAFSTTVAGLVVPVGQAASPPQAVNAEVPVAVAETGTDAPAVYVPAPVVVPVPAPAVPIVNVYCLSANAAVHVVSLVSATVAGLVVPVGQPVPLQPVKSELPAGVALICTDVPAE